MDLKKWIRDVPDFPKPGIMFRDISPLLADHKAWHAAVERLAEMIAPHKPDLLAGIESRGFLIAAPVAVLLGCGFVMIRKKGKLPGKTIPHTYDLEYGSDTLEIHKDAIQAGQSVIIVDDLLATGGTANACVQLAKSLGADIAGLGFVVELDFLHGRRKFEGIEVFSLLHYDK